MDEARRFSVTLMLVAAVLGLNAITLAPPSLSSWLQLSLTTPVVIWGVLDFLKMRERRLFTLMESGVVLAYIYSLFAFLFPDLFLSTLRANGEVDLHFDVAAVLSVLILLEQRLLAWSWSSAGADLGVLQSLFPEGACRIRADGSKEDLLLAEVKVNDYLCVSAGERVPVDGELVEGRATVDEFMMTGETVPVEKRLESKLVAGTSVLAGNFILCAEQVGDYTLLSQVIAQVKRVGVSPLSLQRLAIVSANYLLPFTLIFALAAFFVWYYQGPYPALRYSFISALSVLIVASPAALKLAHPLVMLIGVSRGARAGIVFNSAFAIEKFARAEVLIVDRESIFTFARLSIKSLIPSSHVSGEELLYYAGSLCEGSEYPLECAMKLAAGEVKLDLRSPSEFYEEKGLGIRGVVDHKAVVIGNLRLLRTLKIPVGRRSLKVARRLECRGEAVQYVVVDNRIAGLIGISGHAKATALLALKKLSEEGLRIIMVSEDNFIAASMFARVLGIDAIESEIRPQQKNTVIEKLRAEGFVVAEAVESESGQTVLSPANISMALCTSPGLVKSADISLTKGELLTVYRARLLSRHIIYNGWQNLGLAVIYNLFFIPVAMGFWYLWTGQVFSPVVAGILTILVVLAIRLNAFRLGRGGVFNRGF